MQLKTLHRTLTESDVGMGSQLQQTGRYLRENVVFQKLNRGNSFYSQAVVKAGAYIYSQGK